MARIVVLGAGLAGLSTAMLLARDGHEVSVLERDPVGPPPPDRAAEGWERWDRPGVPQFRLPHFMLPRWWAEVRVELPEVGPRLLAAGAERVNIITALPAARRGGLRVDDDRFDSVTARRPVLESALSAAAGALGVMISRGVTVKGLMTTGEGPVPRVAGVHTHDGETIAADLVVDCTGRHSALGAWLAAVGAQPPVEERADSGFVYFGRHFRSRTGGQPAPFASYLQNYHSVTILTLPADNDTWSVTFTTSSRDKELRALEPARWQAALRHYPLVAHWGEAEPISDVVVFAGSEDRHRRFTVAGEPIATGVVALADSWACTNPSLGRGAAMGLVHARVLRDLLRELAPDEVAFARRFAGLTAEVVEPLYRQTVGYDNHRLAELDADIAGTPYRTEDQSWLIGKALVAASITDPELVRPYAAISGFLAPPQEVLSAPGLLDRALAGMGAPPYPLPGPSRSELLAALA